MTEVTESLSFTVCVGARPTGLVTGYDGGDGVEAKPATKRDDHLRTALLPFVVTDTVQPRHLRHEREKNKAGRPVGRGSRGCDGVRDGVVSRTRDFVTLRHLLFPFGARSVESAWCCMYPSDATHRSFSAGSDRVGTGVLGVWAAVVTLAVTGDPRCDPPLAERDVRPRRMPAGGPLRASGSPWLPLWLQQGSRNNFRIIASPELACFGGYRLIGASNVGLRQHHEARAAA